MLRTRILCAHAAVALSQSGPGGIQASAGDGDHFRLAGSPQRAGAHPAVCGREGGAGTDARATPPPALETKSRPTLQSSAAARLPETLRARLGAWKTKALGKYEKWHRRSHLFVRRLRCDFMISLEDCVALCGLSEEQVLAIAEHEHLPEIAATALAQYLLKRERGMEKIRDMIVDDIRQAQRRQDKAHILTLLHVLHHFLKSHPEICPLQHPWSQLY
jgi:hypothetical protein